MKLNRQKKFSFCTCPLRGSIQEIVRCKCGEEYCVEDWVWGNTSQEVVLTSDKCQVSFHDSYSSGTAVVRGESILKQNFHHYWEIKILSKVYGTDLMIGVGSENIDYTSYSGYFCSMLALNKDSFGYSYRGKVGNNNEMRSYGLEYGQGSIIGVHLDMYLGTLEFFHNRKPLGIAFTNLKHLNLYPMVCVTAAHTSIRLTCSLSVPSKLQIDCLKTLKQNRILKKSLNSVPGLITLLQNKYWWYMTSTEQDCEICDKSIISHKICIDSDKEEDKQQDSEECLIVFYGKRRKEHFSQNVVKENPIWDELRAAESEEETPNAADEQNTESSSQCKCGKNGKRTTRKSNAHHFSCSICLKC